MQNSSTFLSSSSSVPSPSVILHIDLDCFYAQVEAVRMGVSLDEPFGVLQWNSLLAVSYSARKFGVSRMDNAADAKQKCPQIQICHTMTYAFGDDKPQYYPVEQIAKNTHKVSLETYRNASKQIFNVLRSFNVDEFCILYLILF